MNNSLGFRGLEVYGFGFFGLGLRVIGQWV